jgi:hypothetical protein
MPDSLSNQAIIEALVSDVSETGSAKIADNILMIRGDLRSPWLPYGRLEDPQEAAQIIDHFFNG